MERNLAPPSSIHLAPATSFVHDALPPLPAALARLAPAVRLAPADPPRRAAVPAMSPASVAALAARRRPTPRAPARLGRAATPR